MGDEGDGSGDGVMVDELLHAGGNLGEDGGVGLGERGGGQGEDG